jgi:hypothetical protein
MKIKAAKPTAIAAGTTMRSPIPMVAILKTTADAEKINRVSWKFIDSVA